MVTSTSRFELLLHCPSIGQFVLILHVGVHHHFAVMWRIQTKIYRATCAAPTTVILHMISRPSRSYYHDSQSNILSLSHLPNNEGGQLPREGIGIFEIFVFNSPILSTSH